MVGHYVEMAIVFSFNSCYGFQLKVLVSLCACAFVPGANFCIPAKPTGSYAGRTTREEKSGNVFDWNI